MNTVNAAVLGSICQDANAALEKTETDKQKAENTYWKILLDPARTSDSDRKAMAAAMKLLGKTPRDLTADASAVEASHALAADAADRHPARKAVDAAEAELREFHTVTKLAMQQKIADLLKEKTAAVEAAKQRLNTALVNFYRLGQHGKENAHLAARMHPEAMSVGKVWINGSVYDPDNPQR